MGDYIGYETCFITFYFMPRPLCKKIVGTLPENLEFFPSGKDVVEFNVLKPEEFEAVRLCGSGDCNMKDGAQKMGVSAATFNRLKNRGFKKIIDALCEGRGIKIDNKCN